MTAIAPYNMPTPKELQYLAAKIAHIARGNDLADLPSEPREDHDPETCEICDQIALLIAGQIMQATKWGLDVNTERQELQSLVDDLYVLFTSTPAEIAAKLGEGRCKDDSARVNYALELLTDHVS